MDPLLYKGTPPQPFTLNPKGSKLLKFQPGDPEERDSKSVSKSLSLSFSLVGA